MSLSFIKASPGIMLTGVIGYLGYGTFVHHHGGAAAAGGGGGDVPWQLPALACAWFWGFSLYTIAQEGVLAVWQNHNQNYWGNQVWFDLLFSVSLFWFALLPRAKKVGMVPPVLPWLVYVCSTASIGGLHFYSRILYLEQQQQQKQQEEVKKELQNETGSSSSKKSN